MERTTLGAAEFRFGEFGPGYIMRGPRTDFGVVQLRPGDEASNHYHAHIEENFVVLEGTSTLWINCHDKYTVTAGDYIRCDPGEMHYFVNEGDEVFRALFVKAPFDPNDGVQVPWQPGDELPEEARKRIVQQESAE